MNDYIEPYGTEDARQDAERLKGIMFDLDALLDDVTRRIAETESVRNRDFDWDHPNMDAAQDAARYANERLNDFRDFVHQLADEMETAADRLAELNVEDDSAETESAVESSPDDSPPPAEYTDRADIPLKELPTESHYDRMSTSEKFAARNDRDPLTRHECDQCHRQFRSRAWVGPCNDCHEKSKGRP